MATNLAKDALGERFRFKSLTAMFTRFVRNVSEARAMMTYD